MTVSKLASGTYLAHSSNYEKGRRRHKICKITPHIMAGKLTGKQCAINVFGRPNKYASANYCIGYNGDIICNVAEENRAYTSSNWLNDCQAITIEISNTSNNTDKISEASWNSLVKLCVDICQRYNFRLNYDGTKNGSLTRHNMFANKACPGKYLQARFPELAKTVNAILDGEKAVSTDSLNYQSYDNVKKKWLPNVKIGTSDYIGNFGNAIGGLYIDNLEYRVHDKVKGKWLPWVKGRLDYAGNLGNAIDGVQIKGVNYRVHIKGGSWLPWVNKVDDTNNGYAGIYGREIDAIQVK